MKQCKNNTSTTEQLTCQTDRDLLIV